MQVCTTTPCMLGGVGSERIVRALERELGVPCAHTVPGGAENTTQDAEFTLCETECLGACVNAPVVKVNDDFYVCRCTKPHSFRLHSTPTPTGHPRT